MIRIETSDGIALLHFERPPANAIELGSAVALEEALAHLEADAGTRAGVLTGQGGPA
jgi:enoyl-CoA hydratase/carnithine racemase